MQIELVIGQFDRMVGQAWYVAALQKYLARIDVDFTVTNIEYPLLVKAGHSVLKPLGYDLKAFFTTYPVAAKLGKQTIKHFTTQQMASLLSFQKVEQPIIITVHDIIPYMMRDNPELTDYHRFYDRWMDRLAVTNLSKAEIIITDAEYTRRVLMKELRIPEKKIRAILLGLDLGIFKPTPVSTAFLSRYQLSDRYRYILYVGSEIPRKNLIRLLEAFAIVKGRNPDARLIKIGSPNQMRFYQKLLDHIDRLNIQNEVILLNHVSRDDLILFYNQADVFVFPSLYEGFGIPPLEAMACGAPVICSNTASLPEVVGDAAIMVDPSDIKGWADAMEAVLNDRGLQENLREKSIKHASQFSWERMARETLSIYQEAAEMTQ